MSYPEKIFRSARGKRAGAAFMLAMCPLLLTVAPAAATTCSTVAACVLGTNTGSGFGVEGTSKSGGGVIGMTTYNATSGSAAKNGVAGYDASSNKKAYNSGVYGSSSYGFGTRGQSQNGVGAAGTSVSNVGVSGKSGSSYGVSGSSVSSYGVYGSSRTQAGVYGTSASSSQPGVYGFSDYDAGFGTGVLGVSYDGVGVEAVSQSSEFGFPFALTAVAGDSNVRIFEGRLDDSAVVSIDSSGNMILAGTLQQNGTPSFRTRGANGSSVATFGDRLSVPTLEDLGEAQLVNGRADVVLDPKFAASVDARSRYLVFLTPMGETHGLFVSERSARGFTVREAGGGRSSLVFDYRIAAKPYDTAPARLPSATSLPQLRHNIVDRMLPLAQRRLR